MQVMPKTYCGNTHKGEKIRELFSISISYVQTDCVQDVWMRGSHIRGGVVGTRARAKIRPMRTEQLDTCMCVWTAQAWSMCST